MLGLSIPGKGGIEKYKEIKILNFMKEAYIFRELVDHSLIGRR